MNKLSRFRLVSCIATAGILLPRLGGQNSFSQNWRADSAFTIPVIESAAPAPSNGIAALPDGRVLIITNHHYVNGRKVPSLVRLNQDGAVDSSYAAPPFQGLPHIVNVYDDGRALLLDDSGLIRLLPNGAIDPSFVLTLLHSDFGVNASPCPDGRTWVWGRVEINFKSVSVALLKPGGGWDTSFILPTGASISVSDAAVQADGKLVVGGTLVLPGPVRRRIFRLNLDGSIDPTLDSSVAWPVSDSSASDVSVVAALADGKILAGSSARFIRLLPNGVNDTSYHPSLASGTFSPKVTRASTSGTFYYNSPPDALRRLNADGKTDPFFMVSGDYTAPCSWDDRTVYFSSGITAERQKKRLTVSRVTSVGAVDPDFSPRISTVAATSWLRQPDGKYLVWGSFDYINGTAFPSSSFNYARLNADGSLDRDFRLADSVAVGSGITPGVISAVQPDGGILAIIGNALSRMNPDGSRDGSFTTIPSIGRFALDPRGNIYTTKSNGTIGRHRPNGTLDPSFSVVAPASFGTLMVTPDEKMVVDVPYFSQRKLIRLLPNGDADPSYPGAVDFTRSSYSFVMLADGSVLAFGQATTLEPNYLSVRIYRFDQKGARTFACEVAPNEDTIAGVVHDVLTANALSSASSGLNGVIRLGGKIDVQGTEITVAHYRLDSSFAEVLPFARYCPDETGRPVTPLGPIIFSSPVNRSATRGSSTSLSVQAFGRIPFTFQWLKNGVPIDVPHFSESSSIDSFTLINVQVADAGDYSVIATNSSGTATSAIARLDIAVRPTVSLSPPSITVAPNQTVALTLSSAGTDVSYQWFLNGAAITSPMFASSGGNQTLLLNSVAAANAGTYSCVVSNSAGTVTTTPAIVAISSTADIGRLTNVSVRTRVGLDDQSLVIGFVVASGAVSGGQPLLIRAAGPSL